METFSASLAICAGNSPVPGEFSAQRPVTRRFDVFCDLRLSKRLSKQWWGWWFETLSRPLWRHCNVVEQLRAHRLVNLDLHYYCVLRYIRTSTLVCGNQINSHRTGNRHALTHEGPMTHKCVSLSDHHCSYHGLSHLRCLAIIWTNEGFTLNWIIGNKLSRFRSKVQQFSYK